MIIDIHSHVLPNIDDGAKDFDEAKKMLDIYVSEEIGGVILTPHYEVGMGKEWILNYRDSYIQISEYIKRNSIPINIYIGNEIYYSEGVIDALNKSHTATLNNSKYVLVEFPVYADYEYIQRAVCNLQYSGYWPILAHVERYHSLESIDRISELINLGAYIQVNASTVIGKMGLKSKHFVMKLLKKRLIHFIATDAHGFIARRPKIQEALSYIINKTDEKYCRILTEVNPSKVLKGERIVE